MYVPAEYRHGIYVEGAKWLLTLETTNPQSLKDCKIFQDTILDMAANQPGAHDSSNPANMEDSSIVAWGDGELRYNNSSLSV